MAWSWFEFYGDDYFEGLSMKSLGRDEAFLRITNEAKQLPVYLLHSHRECIECDYQKEAVIYAQEDWKIKSSYTYKISKFEYDTNQEKDVLCDVSQPIGEFGVYNITFDENSCSFRTLKEPVNIYSPILTVFSIYILLILAVVSGIKLRNKFSSTKNSMDIQQSIDADKTRKPRIKSLDVFRGISIVTMIFVNLGAGGYEILDHAPWNGLHLADFVFPCFLWIMGACIPISLLSNFKKGVTNNNMIQTVIKRSIKLFCLGIFLNSGQYLDKFRFMGVLQRFGICYFFVTLVCIYTLRRKYLLNVNNSSPNALTAYKVTSLGWFTATLIAVLHLCIIFFVADEYCEKGYFGPGGLHKHGKYINCTGGATGYLDRAILGPHAFQHPTSVDVFESQAFDPEGLIGCLNSIFHTFIGVQAGVILLVYKEHKHRLLHWTSLGVLAGISGGILCGFTKEDGWIPINKNLWSLSFVLVTSCVAFILLSICYAVIDMKNLWQGAPFYYAGMNSILMYVGHQLTPGFFPFSWKINSSATQTHFLFFSEGITATVIWMIIAYYLYKIKFFLTI